MARIKNYINDVAITSGDKFLGTDQSTGATKNFTFGDLVNAINDQALFQAFDGAIYNFKELSSDESPSGIINITGTNAITTDFNAVTQVIVSKINTQGDNIANYIDGLLNYHIKISNAETLDEYAIFRVDGVEDYLQDADYKRLTLNFKEGNGSLTSGSSYFLSLFQASYDTDLSSRSVTEFGDMSSAGSGNIITTAERITLNSVPSKIDYNDIVDNLIDNRAGVPLSANQGKVIKGLIDDINTLLTSDNVNLDTLQEVVDFIEANKDTLDNLTISNIAGLQNALDDKVDKVLGKELSDNNFTDALLNKLNAIAAGAEVNVQSDWNQTLNTEDDFILNKPTDITDLSLHNVTELSDVFNAGSGYIITDVERTKLTNIVPGSYNIITNAERTKLTGIENGAEVNVQANWNETDNTDDAFILNKPAFVDPNLTITITGTANEIEVSPNTAQDLTANRTFQVGLPDNVTVTNNLSTGNDLIASNDLKAGRYLQFTTPQSQPPAAQNAIYVTTEDTHDVMHFRYHGHDLSIDTLTENIPTGITSGGELSKTSNTQFTINAGTGIINDLNKESTAAKPYPEILNISWSTQTITVANLDVNDPTQKNAWIYIDDQGAVQQQTTSFTEGQYSSYIPIGVVLHSSGVILFTRTFPQTAYNTTDSLQQFARIFGPLKKDGHLVSANGANLSLDRSQGTAFAFGRNYVNNPNSPSIVIDAAKTQAQIHRYYKDGSGGYIKDNNNGAGYTEVDPTKWDAGTGSLSTVPGGQFTIQRFYFFPATPDVIVVYYGDIYYSSIEVAERNFLTSQFDEADNTAQQAIYLGAAIISGGANNLQNVNQAKFFQGGIFRNLSAAPVGNVAGNAVLNDLIDVTVQTPANEDILQYNSTTQQFQNVPLASVIGGDSAKEALYNVIGIGEIYYMTQL